MISKDKYKIKTTKTFSSVDSTRYKKVLQKKQRLYEKFLKTRTAKSEAEYKTYKKMFQTIKRKSKRNYYSHKKYLNIKITLKNMEYYEGDNRQNKQIKVSSTYQTCNQQKRRGK